MPWIDGLLAFKKRVQQSVLSCEMFTMNYPSVFAHMIHEAERYREDLAALESDVPPKRDAMYTLSFWDEDMTEHLEAIRGMLDPSEMALMQTANELASAFQGLKQRTKEGTDASTVSEETLQLTRKFRSFGVALTKGIAACKVRSVMLPLFADHMLREANHYLRLLS